MTGGGTGGHIYPGIAIAKALQAQGLKVAWLGAERGLEKELVPKADIPLHLLRMQALRQGGLLARAKSLLYLLLAVRQARKVLKKSKPGCVLALGGYASVAGGIAAKLKKVPLFVLEQNAAAGMANKLLARFAKKIFLGFPGTFTGPKVIVVGNPVRTSIQQIESPSQRFTVPREETRILILGGSLGARIFNQVIPPALNALGRELKLSITHIAGKGNAETVRQVYACEDVHVLDYCHDIESVLANSDVVIARAGAMTVTEIAHSGVAAIFVPIPTAVDDHQTKNANFLVEKEAAKLIPQKAFNQQNLLQVLKPLCQSHKTLHTMAQRAYDARLQNSIEKIMKEIKENL